MDAMCRKMIELVTSRLCYEQYYVSSVFLNWFLFLKESRLEVFNHLSCRP